VLARTLTLQKHSLGRISRKIEGQIKSLLIKIRSNKEALDHFNTEAPKEEEIEIRQIKYLNNIVEQDHRFTKKRTMLTLGYKNFYSAKESISGI
jgi:transposase-like protein